MPLVKVEQVNTHKYWGIWHISESHEELLSQLDLTLELDDIHEISHPKKKQEWASSRLIAKVLLQQLNKSYFGIKKDEFGKPWLNNLEGFISISHKFPYVTVLIDLENEVGIDIEPVTEKIIRLGPKFLSEEEAKWANTARWITLLWAAKEALYKLHGRKQLIFKEQLLIEKGVGNEVFGEFIGRIIDNTISEYKLIYDDGLEDVVLVYTEELKQ